MSDHIDRDQLYAAVWAEPATKVAARYGITSTALAKICRKLRVPTPPRGYWAKKAAGHRVTRAQLPKALRGQRTVHVFSDGGQPTPPEPPSVAAERARERIVVSEQTTDLHPLLRKYEARLRRRGDKMDLWSQTECIALRASREQLDRALRIMSALLHAFDERGIVVEVTRPGGPDEKSETIVTVHGERFHIGLAEDARMEAPEPEPMPPAPPRGTWKSIADPKERAAAYAAELLASQERPRLTPSKPARQVWTGELRLWMSPLHRSWHSWGQQQFRDTPKHKLEERLSRFVFQLHVVAQNVREERERQQAEAERRAEEERIRADRERAHQRQERLREDLGRRVEAYRRAGEIRELIEAVASRPTVTSSAQAWIEWARGRAELVEQSALEVERVWETA